MLAVADPTDLDNGPRTAKSGTARMCAVTRQVQPIDNLIRFVIAPTGEVIADLKHKLPGRGLWISTSHSVLAEAVKRGVFSRGFKSAGHKSTAHVSPVHVSPNLISETEALLVRGIIEALAMAGKAGDVVAGFTKVEAAVRSGAAMALIHASDGAHDGIRKLDALARQTTSETNLETAEIPILTPLTSAELDLALGRSNVIHAALRAGSAAKTVLTRCQALGRFRQVPGPTAKTSVTKTSATKTLSHQDMKHQDMGERPDSVNEL
jgi:predicted RNA-binding protein YlxR (DUF448 family)